MTRRNWKENLRAILRDNNGRKDDGTVASYETQAARRAVLFQIFEELRSIGFKLDDPRGLRGKHVQALATSYEHRGLAPATIQKNFSVMRLFAKWIGKEGMVEKTERYFSPGFTVERSQIARTDKSWSGAGIDVNAKIAEIHAKDARVGLQAELMAVFGLRPKESALLRPHAADKGAYLIVAPGTKGGRERTIPIDTSRRRELIDQAKRDVLPGRSLIPDGHTWKSWSNHMRHVAASVGVCKSKLGVTLYGLRHEYAQQQYHLHAGAVAPVAGGCAVERNIDINARQIVAQDLGHNRIDITNHYLGKR